MKFISVILISLLAFPSESAVILKIKNNRALIHLEGLQAKKGDFFEALDLYGKGKGLIQIKKVGDKKAIGVLKIGQMRSRWSLEPKSRKWVMSRINQRKISRLREQNERYQRELSKQRKIVERERKIRRGLASAQENSDLIIDENSYSNQDTYANRNSRIDNRNRNNYSSNNNNYSSDDGTDNYNRNSYSSDDSLYDNSSYASPRGKAFMGRSIPKLTIGLRPEVNFSLVRIKIHSKKQLKMIRGLGFGANGFIEGAVNRYLSVGGYFGFRRFSVTSKDDSLRINYATIGSNLKFNFLNTPSIKSFIGLDGSLFYPIEYDNQSHITKNSFGLHGSIGPILGIDLLIRNFVIPIHFAFDVVTPPTKTTLIMNARFYLGFGFKF